MTTESHIRMSGNSYTKVWIPAGMTTGLLAGYFLRDISIGLSIGLMTGSVVAMCLERKAKKTANRVMTAIGVLAIIVVAISEVIERSPS